MVTVRSSLALIALFSLTLAPVRAAAPSESATTWSGFRGAAGSGVSEESGLPVSWSETKHLAWQIDLPGRGNSSPTVTSKCVFLTTQMSDKSLHVLAIDRSDGRMLWNKDVGGGELATTGPKRLYVERHDPATPTAVADEEHVWAFFGSGRLVCFDHEGELKWKQDLVSKYGDYDIAFGMASSPRLWGDLLYLAAMHKGASYVVALDKRSGEEVWKTSRTYPAEDDGFDSYSSPIVYERPERTELLVSGADHVDAYDMKSGKKLWFSSGLKIDSQYGRILASPAVADNAIVVCSGDPAGAGLGHVIALKPGGSGDITESHRLWKYSPNTPDSPTPVCYQGKAYMISDEGVASCIDVITQKRYWRKRLAKGPYHASTIAGDGKVYFLSLDGVCTVVAAGEKGETLHENALPGTFYATPAVGNGRMYLRGHHKLYAVGSE